MTHESLLNGLWQTALTRLGGAAAIEASAREMQAFRRGRAVKSAADLLRLILAYCLGGMGLRLTSAWAASAGPLQTFPMSRCLSACATPAPGWNSW